MENTRLLKLSQMLADEPGDLFLQYAIGMEHLGMQEHREAREWFEKVLQCDPMYLAVYYQLGRLYEGDGEVQKAAAVYERGLEVAAQKKDQKALREIRAALDELML